MASFPLRTVTSSSASFAPLASLAEHRGAVPMPSICPRASMSQAPVAERRNVQNFRLDEPALITSAYSLMDKFLGFRATRMRDQHGHRTAGNARPHTVGPA